MSVAFTSNGLAFTVDNVTYVIIGHSCFHLLMVPVIDLEIGVCSQLISINTSYCLLACWLICAPFSLWDHHFKLSFARWLLAFFWVIIDQRHLTLNVLHVSCLWQPFVSTDTAAALNFQFFAIGYAYVSLFFQQTISEIYCTLVLEFIHSFLLH